VGENPNEQSFQTSVVIYERPSESHSMMFPLLLLVVEGGGVLFLFYQVSAKCVVPISFKKPKLYNEVSPSFPLRFQLAWINRKSATNKEEKMNSSTSDVK